MLQGPAADCRRGRQVLDGDVEPTLQVVGLALCRSSELPGSAVQMQEKTSQLKRTASGAMVLLQLNLRCTQHQRHVC